MANTQGKRSEITDNEDYTKKNFHPSDGFKSFFDIFESLIYAVIAVVVIFIFFARLTIVDGPSMENTLHNKEYIIVSDVLFTYKPKQSDIVVVHCDFKSYQLRKLGYDIEKNEQKKNHYSDPIVKRVIATEGQTIKIDYNQPVLKVFVDGVELDEPYAKYVSYTLYPTLGDIKYNDKGEIIGYSSYFDSKTNTLSAVVPEDHVFVMGDNRNNSADSRLSDIGFVHEDYIVGKAVFRLLPFSKMGGL